MVGFYALILLVYARSLMPQNTTNLRKWGSGLVLLFVSYIYSSYAWPYLGYVLSHEGRLESTVHSVDHSPNRQSPCVTAELIIDYDPGFLSVICVSRPEAGNLSVGDKVELIGRKNWFGFYVLEVKSVK